MRRKEKAENLNSLLTKVLRQNLLIEAEKLNILADQARAERRAQENSDRAQKYLHMLDLKSDRLLLAKEQIARQHKEIQRAHVATKT